MDINTKNSYIVIGTAVNADNSLVNALELPAPNTLPITDQYLADASRSATGVMTLQQIGRAMITSKMTWASMKNTTFWRMNRWFESYGYVFYMKYFDHITGRLKIHKFYKGFSDNVNPGENQEIRNGLSVPTSYKNVVLSVIDIGDNDVKVLQEVSLI